MINRFILTLLIAISLFSCKKEINSSNSTAILGEMNQPITEIFNIAFTADTIIVTKNGNKLHLIKDNFKLKDSKSVQISISEYYTKKDLIFNNIRTLTNSGDLLTSKGVFKVDVLSDDNTPLKLKKGKKIRIDLLEGNYKNNDIYVASVDSLNQFNWVKRDTLQKLLYCRSLIGEIFHYFHIDSDSLDYYRKYYKSIEFTDDLTEDQIEEMKRQNEVTLALFENNKWINIDKLIETPIKKDFNLICKSKDNYEDYMVYVIYDGLNSFTSYNLTYDNLKIEKLPITGNAKGVIMTYSNERILYDEFSINKSTENNIKINLKEINLEDFKQILTSY